MLRVVRHDISSSELVHVADLCRHREERKGMAALRRFTSIYVEEIGHGLLLEVLVLGISRKLLESASTMRLRASCFTTHREVNVTESEEGE